MFALGRTNDPLLCRCCQLGHPLTAKIPNKTPAMAGVACLDSSAIGFGQPLGPFHLLAPSRDQLPDHAHLPAAALADLLRTEARRARSRPFLWRARASWRDVLHTPAGAPPVSWPNAFWSCIRFALPASSADSRRFAGLPAFSGEPERADRRLEQQKRSKGTGAAAKISSSLFSFDSRWRKGK